MTAKLRFVISEAGAVVKVLRVYICNATKIKLEFQDQHEKRELCDFLDVPANKPMKSCRVRWSLEVQGLY